MKCTRYLVSAKYLNTIALLILSLIYAYGICLSILCLQNDIWICLHQDMIINIVFLYVYYSSVFSVWNVQEFLTQCRHKIERIYDLWDILACSNECLWCVSPKIHENDKIGIQDIRKCVTLRDITQNKSKLHRSAEYWMPLYVTYI